MSSFRQSVAHNSRAGPAHLVACVCKGHGEDLVLLRERPHRALHAQVPQLQHKKLVRGGAGC